MNRKNPLLNVGWSLMLLIFVALLLTTFSVLSAVTSKSQLDLSEKFAQAQKSYYGGSSDANQRLMEIDAVLFEISKENSSNYNISAYEVLRNEDGLECSFDGGICTVAYSVPCDNGTNDINVKISLEDCGGSDQPRYKILNRTFVNTTENIDEYIEEDVHWWGE